MIHSNKRRKFAKMYEEYADDIFRYIYVRTQDKELAEDMLSETFTKALSKLDTFDFKQPRPWLYTIARNVMHDHWRKKSSVNLDEAIEVVDEEAKTVEEVADHNAMVDVLKKALHTLPDQHREIIELKFFRNLSSKDIAATLDLTPENVRIIQHRALKALKKEMAL